MKCESELARIKELVSIRTPDNPALTGFKVYSQNDEDGIIESCLSRIAEICDMSKTFIEVGCGNGLENNTHYLLLKGYRGCWVDGNKENIQFIHDRLGRLQFDELLVQGELLTRDRVKHRFSEFNKFLGTSETDLLSIDTDGNDLYLLLEALTTIRPKLICMEYNAKFPPPLALCMDYNDVHKWKGNDYFGASLQAFVDALPNYRLVSCGISGVNAFFVREDVANVFAQYDVSQLYQPARYWLAELTSGHAANLEWLKQKLTRADNIGL